MSLIGRRTMTRLALAAGIAIAGAGGCTQARDSPTASTEPTGPNDATDSPTEQATATGDSGAAGSTSVPAPTGDATGSVQVLQARDDLVSPAAVAWDSWELVDPRTIELTFLAGPAQCEGVSAEVLETDQDVTINLSVGTLPDAGACQAIALTSTTRVALGADLGDRTVRQDAG
ncbi:Hypothetical protein ACGLYG10_1921 [Actinomyces glycerinitolerans]|uniref:Prokaryotic membrane lipoprotein lipid attachment site profile n=2 Tax=Actinomyces glycerinitolerans TaxID=1892869 RepID=A0A1M4S0I5_9ACTO|nr:Hypothetical protein ACGLYG10_1921 [Actinomyces glycerinitolerans]